MTTFLNDARQQSLMILLSDVEFAPLRAALLAAEDDYEKSRIILKAHLAAAQFAKFERADALAEWADDDVAIINAIKTTDIPTLRELALQLSSDKINALLPADLPAEVLKARAERLRSKLYTAEPTAALQRMASAGELKLDDAAVEKGVAQFLINLPDFNFRTSKLDDAFALPAAFKDVPDATKAAVKEKLKELQKSIADMDEEAAPAGPAAEPIDVAGRIKAVGDLLSYPEKTALARVLEATNGDWSVAETALQLSGEHTAEVIRKLGLANALAEWARNDADVVKEVVKQSTAAGAAAGPIPTLQEVALQFGLKTLATILPGANQVEKERNAALARRTLFNVAATEVVRRMVKDNELPIQDQPVAGAGPVVKATDIQSGIDSVLSKLTGFDISKTDLPKAVRDEPAATAGIESSVLRYVMGHIGWVQNLMPFVPIPEILKPLISTAITSAVEFLKVAFDDVVKSITEPVAPDEGKKQAEIMVEKANAEVKEQEAAAPQLPAQRGVLAAVIDKPSDKALFDNVIKLFQGDVQKSLDLIQKEKLLPESTTGRLTAANKLAEWSNNEPAIVNALVRKEGITSVQDVALKFNAKELAAALPAPAAPAVAPAVAAFALAAPAAPVAAAPAAPAVPAHDNLAIAKNLLDKAWPTTRIEQLHRMNRDHQLVVADENVRTGVATALTNLVGTKLDQTSVAAVVANPKMLNGVNEEHRGAVAARVASILSTGTISSTSADEVLALDAAGIRSAHQLTELSKPMYVKTMAAKGVAPAIAERTYEQAVNRRIQTEQVMASLREAVVGTGLAVIDGPESRNARIMELRSAIAKYNDDPAVLQKIPINLELLFGSLDYCECGECTSVYSAAAYFVDLLQYLRNNNLDPSSPFTGATDIKGTVLEKLFFRRPDLGRLLLTCPNTNTVIPYVDLANEVMESFIVNLDKYHADPNDPKQAILEVFNTEEDQTNEEQLAQHQNTNHEAYCVLKSAVYPFTLPYHQPVDVMRIYLKHLKTTRYEILDVFRSPYIPCPDPSLSEAEHAELEKLHYERYQRGVDAEFLGLTQEEYILLTKEAFKEKRYYEITKHRPISKAKYQRKIGIKPVEEYFGYGSAAEMSDLDETKAIGLAFVKKQFLPRTGVSYSELVDLLKTRFINRKLPQGRAMLILQSLQFSYRYLQSLVDTSSTDPKVRYAKVIEALENPQSVAEVAAALALQPQLLNPKTDFKPKELRNWVYRYFKKVGQLIVLGNGPALLYTTDDKIAGTLNDDGSMVDRDGKPLGSISLDGKVLNPDGSPFATELNVTEVPGSVVVGLIKDGRLRDPKTRKPINWLPAADICDSTRIRLRHLDGTPVTGQEFDRMQRFIRLWRKLGWTIPEVDLALLSKRSSMVACHVTGFEEYREACVLVDDEDGGCEAAEKKAGVAMSTMAPTEITPAFLRQLTAIRKLVESTGLPVDKLLTFWSDINTAGEKPLYVRLFLTHDLLGMDKVFKADSKGNYLTGDAKISEHLPALMAALTIRSIDELNSLLEFLKSANSAAWQDQLSLANVSAIYRSSLLCKVLKIKSRELTDFVKIFGDPFATPWATWSVVKNWGKLSNAGFKFAQVNYMIQGKNDPDHPLAPTLKNVLQITQKLYEGLNSIQSDHADLTGSDADKAKATDELVRAKLELFFKDPASVDDALGLLNGTRAYPREVPPGLGVIIPAPLNLKAAYTETGKDKTAKASLVITGILTEAETSQLKGLSAHPKWIAAIDRAGRQAVRTFNITLAGVFPDPAELEAARKILLQPDINPLPKAGETPDPNASTASLKRHYFLQKFLPYLREFLSQRLIVQTLAGGVKLTPEVAEVLLTQVFSKMPARAGDKTTETALATLQQVQSEATTREDEKWSGYLVPATDGNYRFFSPEGGAQPMPLYLDGQAIEFMPLSAANDEWWTEPQRLKGGTVYRFQVDGLSLTGDDGLKWNNANAKPSAIPASALYPAYALGKLTRCQTIINQLSKAAVLINGFSLSSEEVKYLAEHPDQFEKLDFQTITWKQLLRLEAYAKLRNSLRDRETELLVLFKSANTSQTVDLVSNLLGSDQDVCAKLITHYAFALDADFKDEVSLTTLRTALDVVKKTGAGVDQLFRWAEPGTRFWCSHRISNDIRKLVRSRYTQTDWEQAVKPLNNELRAHQRNALIAHLLVQPDLIKWGVIDADSLFEFLLIDVQMEPCMQTSRMVQAISTVQLFVQRCFLGQEQRLDKNGKPILGPDGKPIGIEVDKLDRERWKWMQRYRVWEANRKVFLYPENWIQPSLRDDKSPFFKELESELLQKDVNPETIQEAIKNYVFKLDDVANLKVVGLFLERDIDVDGNEFDSKLHVFSRTRNAPYAYYYRYYNVREASWIAWEKVQVDIPSYDAEVKDSGRNIIEETGSYLTPVVWNGRLLIFFPQFTKKTATQESVPIGGKKFRDIGNNNTPDEVKPIEYWEIKLAWSEYRNRRWTPKQVSSDATQQSPLPDVLPKISSFRIAPRFTADSIDIHVDTNASETWSRRVTRDSVEIFYTRTTIATDTRQLLVGMAVSGVGIDAGTTVASIDHASNTCTLSARPNFEEYHTEFRFPPPRFVRVRNESRLSNLVFDTGTKHSTPRRFRFDGGHIHLTSDASAIGLPDTRFHYIPGATPELHTLQPDVGGGPSYFSGVPEAQDLKSRVNMIYRDPDTGDTEVEFSHKFCHTLLGSINRQGIPSLYDDFDSLSKPIKGAAFGKKKDVPEGDQLYHELRRPYSLYNWELGFHAPMMLADRLLNAQQYDQALEMCHYVFDPSAAGDTADPANARKRVWQFLPFKETDAVDALKKVFEQLKPGASDPDVTDWRKHPFAPHGIARRRPSAYMKWTVMQYIRILIAYGDHYFRMNTLEFIPMAIQCYVMAAHLYGPPGQKIPRRGKIRPESYMSLLNRWDAFSNAMVQLELMLPSSNQTPVPVNTSNQVVGMANVFGFATAPYFCIPNNPMLTGLREMIDDRLFKIRHCLDINGIYRQLPLFEPPIDPALLVQATAQGLSLASVLNDLNSPLPNYRFAYLLQKAMELCSELKSLGNAFLSTKEKRDAESLSRLRAQHEISIHKLVMESKKLQLEESNKALDALLQSRKAPEARMRYYLQLVGEDIGRLPDESNDFSELPNQIEQPVSESGLKLIQFEKEEMDRARDSADIQTTVGVIETLASVLSLIPQIGLDAMFWGLGADVKFGGQQLGPASNAVARAVRIEADRQSFQSSNASRKAGFLRALQERIHQANLAGHEIKNIDRQILTQRIRISIAEQEISNQQQQIDNAQAVDDFLRNKYTNDDLYSYMEGSLKTLYYQTYTLAYDLAKKAERAFQFERVKPTEPGNQTPSSFIQLGYWDATHDGLLAGEKLYLALKQLESAYQSERGYDFEIVKQVSLRQLDPLQLNRLRVDGWCDIELPEVLFDMDYPGHFMRRIKSVSLTVPCVVGPYTGLNSTLRLTKNKLRKQAVPADPYPENTEDGAADERFITCNVPIKAIAVSTGQNDSGVFELNFKDERYIPFEGAGAISTWRMTLPTTRQFDYDTIADVVMTVRYTSIDGGERLMKSASKGVETFLSHADESAKEGGVYVAFDLRHDFSSQWVRFSKPAQAGQPAVLDLEGLTDRLPFIAKRWDQQKAEAIEVTLIQKGDSGAPNNFTLNIDGDPLQFDPPTDGIRKLTGDLGRGFANWKMGRDGTQPLTGSLWMIIRITLAS